jgi:hypothetical protein
VELGFGLCSCHNIVTSRAPSGSECLGTPNTFSSEGLVKVNLFTSPRPALCIRALRLYNRSPFHALARIKSVRTNIMCEVCFRRTTTTHAREKRFIAAPHTLPLHPISHSSDVRYSRLIGGLDVNHIAKTLGACEKGCCSSVRGKPK